ncbi:MAG: hypothetical protein H7320_13765 [Ferruginibacter sp.]|nr:hypothetical protein [Ferruginibacter sp.]
MIEVTIHRRRQNYYDGRVREILSLLPSWTQTIEGAERIFNTDVGNIPRMSVATADMLYKIFWADDKKSFEVWHLNILGDKDRLTAKIITL